LPGPGKVFPACATIVGFPERWGVTAPPLPLMLLWVSIALLTLVVTAAVVWPLFSRKSIAVADDDLDRRLAVFRDRRDEIGRERDAGRLTDAEAEQALADLLRQMAEELPPEAIAAAGKPAPQAAQASRSR